MFNQVLSNIHWLHVLVAALAYFALGSVWYSPVLFVKKWIKAANINIDNPDAKKGMGFLFGGSFVLMFIISTGLAVLQQVLPAIDFVGGIKLGLLVSVTLVATSISVNYLYTKKTLALFLIDNGYHIAGMTIASAIIAGWH
jgi:hypothetical protein